MIPLQRQSSDIHNHPVMELSAEKFWAFPGKKSKENFKCVCFVFQKCREKKKGQGERRNQKLELCKSTPSSSGQGSISTVLTPLSPCSKELLQSFADQFSFTFLNSSSNKSYDPLSHFPPPIQKAQTNPCFHRNDGCKMPQEKTWISFLIFCNLL